ncbi:MAG: site-specific integrase, partial [Prevotella bivia]|nr:site-specific integrase [Prevotella bivia]
MRSTFKILFYINKSKTKADGTTAVLCRITIDGANVVISTGENTNPHDWSVKRGETKEKKTNQRLQTFREKVEQGYNTLLYKYGAVSAELLKNHLQGIGRTPTTLLALSAEELKEQKESKSEGTCCNNRNSDKQLNSFVRSLG